MADDWHRQVETLLSSCPMLVLKYNNIITKRMSNYVHEVDVSTYKIQGRPSEQENAFNHSNLASFKLRYEATTIIHFQAKTFNNSVTSRLAFTYLQSRI